MKNLILESQPDIYFDSELQQDLQTEEMLVNMGPQHPATHGVLRVVLRTDGEYVLEAVPHIGYLHRCAEKIGENLQPYQYVPKTDRMDYLAAMNNNQIFSIAVEKLAGLQVPERARQIRVIMAELNRLASHLVAFGTYGLDMGAFTPFLYAFREREMILDLFEMVCGARLTYSYITPGGVMVDLPEGFVERCYEFLDYFMPKIAEYNDLLSYNHIFIKRTANVGVISAADAIAWGLTGPVLRGSGVQWDLRKNLPYEGYEQYEFEVPVGMSAGGKMAVPAGWPDTVVPESVVVGDSWNRYAMRVVEMYWSALIVRQALDRLAPGDIIGKVPKNMKLPAAEVYFEGEGARGQLGFLVVGDGFAIPARVKARGPSFCNLSILDHVCRNCLLADVPAIVGSIDVVMGEVDR
ncbi:MAG: NADH-quinone oxidoreductase subunit 4 [Phycisphaerae bacterium]|nr:NADH-quinone oxidoreductase subunit 4 [Phycisphaerae bacterium]